MIIRNLLLVLSFYFLLVASVFAQFGLPQASLSDDRPSEFVIQNLNLVVKPGQTIKNGSIYVKNGKIVASGSTISYPKNTRIMDGKGQWAYASFIDLMTTYGITQNTPSGPHMPPMGFGVPQYESKRLGNFLWNAALRPEYQAAAQFSPNEKEAEDWRRIGFGWLVTGSVNGIMRGTASLVIPGEGTIGQNIWKAEVLQGFSFQKGQSGQEYPSSQMGAIALIRQTLLDARWYQNSRPKTKNLGLEAVIRLQKFPILFETQQKYEVLRASRLAKEFGLSLIIKGKGDEYQRINEIKTAGYPMIIPVQFPELPDVEDPLDAQLVSLSDMKHWELAPHNARLLAEAGIPFCFTSRDLKDPKSFLAQIRKVVETGLSETAALEALTTQPARLLASDQELGTLEQGRQASFFLSSGPIFQSGSQILAHYIQGNRFEINAQVPSELAGSYRLKIDKDSSFKLKLELKDNQLQWTILARDTQKINTQGQYAAGKVHFSAVVKSMDTVNRIQFTGWSEGRDFGGWAILGQKKMDWKAKRLLTIDTSKSKTETKKDKKDLPGRIWYPFQAFGSEKTPQQQDFVIRNATVWTNEKEGVLKEADVWIQSGKIKAVGKNLTPSAGTLVLDAKGKHLTSGIIDEHSHIAISKGVNEGSSTTSAEVRIGDVIEADDINIYRHLAGGVTAVQQLHGSANTIGGQSSMIKLKWGFAPEEMKISGAMPFNKFALGENVKQSNWGSMFTSRYPQTRMGVEQLLFDAFHRAKSYRVEEQKSKSAKTPTVFKRDLKLEALAEILEGKRMITCHSYVQSEINMLMHVADSMRFKVNTFTHILEGYKVADKMKKHGAGASTFSDWWAYKMEVKDAIPWNAALMHKAGLVVAINSDDAEMARRLNQEAAKAVKYGGISEEDAWKMVTLNPAKLLHLDQRMGSIVAGKDADLVMWSANPLSIEARAEKTFVDGLLMFDLEKNNSLENQNFAERQRIIQKMLQAKKEGQPAMAPQPKVQHLWHCDDEGEE